MHISFKNSEGLNVCNCHENNATMHKTISVFLKVGFIFFRQTWFGVVIWAGRAADSHVSVCRTTLCCRRHSCRSVRDAHSSPAGHRRTADCPAPRRPSTCVPRSSGPPTSWTEHRLQHTHTRSSSDWCNRATLSHWHDGKQIKHTQMKCFCSELVLS